MGYTLDLQSEQYRPEGGAGGDAVRKALGRPRLDNISIIMREAVQNSWDARLPSKMNKGVVQFSARLESLTNQQVDVLRDVVFVSKPKDHPLDSSLQYGIKRLILSDRGTYGLCGPVFKCRRTDPRERRDFIKFFRDIGRDGHMSCGGGGTYGFGKSAFYNASGAATIIVHTRIINSRGDVEDRLMAASLWNPSEDEVYTGRHWWGILDPYQPGLVRPVRKQHAVVLSGKLGFPGFSGTATGTDIMILAPKFAETTGNDQAAAAQCIAETMVIWYWPRMLGGNDGEERIKFRVFNEGEEIEVPNPKLQAPFTLYSAALENLVAKRKEDKDPESPHKVVEIRTDRPKAKLGLLSLSLGIRQNRKEWAVTGIDDHAAKDQLFEEEGKPATTHHIAVMRKPGQVIKYVDTRPYPDPLMEYAGVYYVDGDNLEVEQAYAESEPPSHDDWVADNLENTWHRRYVRVGMRNVKEEAARFSESGRGLIITEGQDPLGAVSTELGQLLSVPGTGPGGAAGGGVSPGSRPPRGICLTLLSDGYLKEHESGLAFVVPFLIDGKMEKTYHLKAAAKVVIAGGGGEKESPQGSSVPRVICWKGPNGRRIGQKEEVDLTSDGLGKWEVWVETPLDASVSVSLNLMEAD